jgi:hypothetical protein
MRQEFEAHKILFRHRRRSLGDRKNQQQSDHECEGEYSHFHCLAVKAKKKDHFKSDPGALFLDRLGVLLLTPKP